MKILAVGSELREDDAAALMIMDKLKHEVINAGTCPENFINEGDSVIIIDAVNFNAEPGSVKLINEEEVVKQAFNSTHNPSLSLIKRLVSKLFLIGIQPHSINYKQGLSNILNEKLDGIASEVNLIITRILNGECD